MTGESRSARRIASLDEARLYVLELASQLDPQSRYVRELLEAIERCVDLGSLDRFLSTESRSAAQIGCSPLLAMSLADKLHANLMTPETYLLRFGEEEVLFLRRFYERRRAAGRRTAIASVPCSIGLEPLSIALILAGAGGEMPFDVVGIDRQPAYLADLSLGKLPARIRGPREILEGFLLEGDVLHPSIVSRISFAARDILADPLPSGFDAVFCRNFLGFFAPDIQARALEAVTAMLAPQGVLCLDEFVLTSERGRAVGEWLASRGYAAVEEAPITFLSPPSSRG